MRVQTRPLLIERLRSMLFLVLASLTFFGVQDVLCFPDRALQLALVKVVQFSFVLAALWALRRERTGEHTVAVAVATCIVLAFLAGFAGILRQNTIGTPLLFIIVSVGTAVAIPWGARAQAILGCSFVAFGALNYYVVDGTLTTAFASPTTGAALSAAVVSVFIARSVEQQRWSTAGNELILRQREERFRALIENGGDLIAVVDGEGLIQYASPSVNHLLGYAADDWLGRSVFDFVHPEDAEHLHEVMTVGAAESTSARALEARFRGAECSWHVLDGSITNLLENGAVGGIVLNLRDVTRRRQMETDLRRSEAALSGIFDSTTDPVWSVDRELRMVAMNSAARQVFAEAYGIELRIGQPIEERAPIPMLSERRALYGRVLAGEGLTTEEVYERDGVTHHHLISMCPIRELDTVTGVTVFSRDITEFRRAEELARRNQAELGHVLRVGTMGEIASSLAHEINQPLGAISNYASACGRWLEAGTGSSSQLHRGLEQISTEALRAGNIIRRLRDLCRKSDGDYTDLVDINGVVRRASELMEPQIRLHGVSLQLKIADELPRARADGIQIEQVLVNLFLNGIESMQASKRKILSVSTGRSNGSVEVLVRDTGAGLDPAIRDRVFDPFFTTKAKGLGMGLAISRRIIEAHGGLLFDTPNPEGGGTTFSFSLPVTS